MSSDTKLIAEQTVEIVKLRLEIETAERQNAALHNEAMIAEARIASLEAKVDLYRRALARVRPHAEAVALARGTGHIQADCDLRAIDGLLA